jgi:hypothetical protein
MFFKKAKFFLDLTGEDNGSNAKGVEKAPVVAAVVAPVAPVEPAAVAVAPAAVAPIVVVSGTFTAAPSAAAADNGGPVAAVSTAARTTAEEIAAELAAAQANRPPASTVTFAPECLVPGASLDRRRRTAGANLAGFRDIARSMMKS